MQSNSVGRRSGDPVESMAYTPKQEASNKQHVLPIICHLFWAVLRTTKAKHDQAPHSLAVIFDRLDEGVQEAEYLSWCIIPLFQSGFRIACT